LRSLKNKKLLSLALAAMVSAGVLFGGCGNNNQAKQQQRTVTVKVVKPLKQDMPMVMEYAGQVQGVEEAKLLPRVTGRVMEKYFKGGQYVEAGQPLFRLDSRQYESAVLAAQAQLSQAQVNLNNAERDLARYQQLYAAAAIAEQMLTAQQATVEAYAAIVAANQAQLQKAQEDLDDCLVVSPIAGRVDVNDVAIGTFAVAGQTNLVTVGSVDPVYVQFSVAEMEYLNFINKTSMKAENSMGGANVKIKLADGTEYPLGGQLIMAGRSLSDGTGSLTVKALFNNPQGKLLPGMFARVVLTGEIVKDAILVPERAIQQVLDKTFVTVVGADNKSEARPVELGNKVGGFYVVNSGVKADDQVVVEGLTKLQGSMEVNAVPTTTQELGISLDAKAAK